MASLPFYIQFDKLLGYLPCPFMPSDVDPSLQRAYYRFIVRLYCLHNVIQSPDDGVSIGIVLNPIMLSKLPYLCYKLIPQHWEEPATEAPQVDDFAAPSITDPDPSTQQKNCSSRRRTKSLVSLSASALATDTDRAKTPDPVNKPKLVKGPKTVSFSLPAKVGRPIKSNRAKKSGCAVKSSGAAKPGYAVKCSGAAKSCLKPAIRAHPNEKKYTVQRPTKLIGGKCPPDSPLKGLLWSNFVRSSNMLYYRMHGCTSKKQYDMVKAAGCKNMKAYKAKIARESSK